MFLDLFRFYFLWYDAVRKEARENASEETPRTGKRAKFELKGKVKKNVKKKSKIKTGRLEKGIDHRLESRARVASRI